MSSQAVLGLWIIGAFLAVCASEAVVILVLAYKLGVYRGKLARYELAERQTPPAERVP